MLVRLCAVFGCAVPLALFQPGHALAQAAPADEAKPAATPAATTTATTTPAPILAPGLEDRDAERLASTLPAAERRWLALGDRKLLAVWRTARRQPGRGAVLLLPGAESSVDSPQVIRPLSDALAAAGWDSLAVAMPRVEPGSGPLTHPALLPEFQSRYAAAEAFLKEQQREVVAMVAEDSAAVAALRLVQATPPTALRALVLIDLPEAADLETLLSSASVAMLDLLADPVEPIARAAAERRQSWAARGSSPRYRQVRLPGVAASWQAHHAQLKSWVLRFLNTRVGS